MKQFQKAGLTQLYIYGGESEITPDQHNEGLNFNLYSIEDLIQVKCIPYSADIFLNISIYP